MADRSHVGGGRSGDYLLNDSRRSSSCPQTWKFAVAILLVCALFLIGVVIGYCISQSSLGRRLDGSCEPQERQHKSSADVGLSQPMTDSRQIKARHLNLTRLLQTAEYSLPSDLM